MGTALVIISVIAALLAAAFCVLLFKYIHIARRDQNGGTVDGITGLANRDSFLKQGAAVLSKKHTDCISLVVIDINDLGKINTLYGSDVGDSVVVGFAETIKALVGTENLCARANSNNFAIMLINCDEKKAKAFLSDLEYALHQKFMETSVLERMEYCAGIAVYDGHDDIQTLFNKANLSIIMNEGAHISVFDPSMETRMVENEFLRTEMLTALDEGQFELYYQPKISFKTGDIMGLEALIRWHHPAKGFVSPGAFIPLAEQTGIITRIDEWGLRTAARQCKQWQEQGLPPVKVSVNMSQAQFYRTDVLSTIRNVLEETQLDPKYLEIEVTETMAMQDIERTVNILGKIREMGISISMDDFGSGYSSLSSLKTMPLDILKIDRSLVCDLDDNDISKSITETIVDLGKAMKLVILAEGVETKGQIKFLTDIGCDLAQGYFYSKPRPVTEITSILMLPREERLARFSVAG